jgi:hypothetical protein
MMTLVLEIREFGMSIAIDPYGLFTPSLRLLQRRPPQGPKPCRTTHVMHVTHVTHAFHPEATHKGYRRPPAPSLSLDRIWTIWIGRGRWLAASC